MNIEKFIGFLLGLLPLTILAAQPPPYQRNPVTTNEPPAMTNVIRAIAGEAGMPWQKGSANLTNWSQLSTNVLATRMEDWQVWVDVSTNYYARSGDATYYWTSNDWSGLANRIIGTVSNLYGATIRMGPSLKNASGPIRYECTEPIIIRANGVNWIGAGNPVTVWGYKTGYTNFAMLQMGTYTNNVGGISTIRDIRFEGVSGGTNGVGLWIVNCPEPVVENSEFNQFRFAGIRCSTTNGLMPGEIHDTWFVTSGAASIGILIDGYIAGWGISQPGHLGIDRCLWSMNGGRGIVISNWLKDVDINNCYFRAENGQWATRPAIEVHDGENLRVRGNTINWWFGSTNAICFAARGSSTNIASEVTGNFLAERFGTNTLVFKGGNITGLLIAYNATNGVSDTPAGGGVGDVTAAGQNNFSGSNDFSAQVNIGTATITNFNGPPGVNAVMEWGTAGGLNTFRSYGSDATTTMSNAIVSKNLIVSNVFQLSKGLRIDGPSASPFVITNTGNETVFRGEIDIITLAHGSPYDVTIAGPVTLTAGLTGDLASGTNMNATELRSGTVAAARLPDLVSSFAIPMGAWWTNGTSDGASLTGAWPFNLTNSDAFIFEDTVTNRIFTQCAMPYDWNLGTVRVGIMACFTNTLSGQTNICFAVRAAAIGGGGGFGTAIITTNRATTTKWQPTEAVTGDLTIGSSPAVNKSVMWEIQRLGSMAGYGDDCATNAAITEVRIYYTRRTVSAQPAATE